MWSHEDEEKVWKLYSSSKQGATDLGKFANIYSPVMENYEALNEDNRFAVRRLVKNFIRLYACMAQIVRTFDKDLLKTYVFAEFLYKFLPKNLREKVDMTGKLALVNSQFKEGFSGNIELAPMANQKTLKPEQGGKGKKP